MKLCHINPVRFFETHCIYAINEYLHYKNECNRYTCLIQLLGSRRNSACRSAAVDGSVFSTTHQRARTNRGVVNYIRLHSIILASCKPGCKPGFRQVRAGLRHAFDFFVKNLVANLLHQSRHVPHVR